MPNPPAPQRPEPVMTAWVIVRDDSSPGAPIYWSGLNRHYSDGGWSHNHQHAVRFAQMQDAEKVASEVRRTTPCHVEEHSWFVSAPPPVAAREEDPFCPQHGPARASDHAAAGCTCPVPPSPPPTAPADLEALVREMLEEFLNPPNDVVAEVRAAPGGDRLVADVARAQARGIVAGRILAHVASLTARLAAAEAETERFQQAALRGIDLAEAYGADRQKAYDKIFQPQRGAP